MSLHLLAATVAFLVQLFAGCLSAGETHRAMVLNESLSPYDGPVAEGLDNSSLYNKVMAGYQGWFRAEGDGSGLGFDHYQKGRTFRPGNCTIDLWPDLSEFEDDELFPTAFRHKDGSTAHVFSSIHPKTVDRHFSCMAEYGIDGAFVQRFGVHGAKQRRD